MATFIHSRFPIIDSHIRKADFIKNLRDNMIPGFRKLAGIKSLSKDGFRLVIDVIPAERLAIVHLMTGSAMPNPTPQDWIAGKPTVWNPRRRNFFDRARVALNGEGTISNKLYNIPGIDDVFGMADGDPKTESHFLMLSRGRQSTMAARNFPLSSMVHLFQGAYQILKNLGMASLPHRYVANFGMGCQQTAGLHCHLLPYRQGIPSLAPEDYGFIVDENGFVYAPTESKRHHAFIKLLKSRGQPENAGRRAEINNEILKILETLRHR